MAAAPVTDGRPILAAYARAGWHLVPIPLGRKGPTLGNWNAREQCVTDPAIAEWLDGNVGLAHAYSGTCAVDVDDIAKSTEWLAARGIALEDLLNAPDAVRIESRPGRAKLLYRLDKPLPSFNLGGLELRCATRSGLTVQDVLPPSIHPDTGQAYAWRGADWRRLPPLPGNLLSLWQGLVAPTSDKPAKPIVAGRNTVADSPRLKALLERHDPDGDYNDWVAVGMALHHESQGSDAGLGLWNEWSSKGRKYKGIGDLELHWRSFKLDHDNPRTLASLRAETVAEALDFPDLTLVPSEERKMPPALGGPMHATQPPGAREKALEAMRSLKRNKLGTIEARISNIVAVLGVPEVAGAELAFDEFQDALMISPRNSAQWRTLADADYVQMRVWLETAGNCDPIPQEMIRQAAMLVAERNKMDTARIWIDGLEWDSTERIEQFCPAYLGTTDSEYTRAVSLYLWTALAGRVMDPGCQADMVPVLIGRQGVGKSRSVQAMVPSPEHYVELRLDEPDDTIARKCRGVLVGELAEMRGLRAADLDRVKAFVTRRFEKWTPKYKEFATNYPRRFVIVGTTNDEEFLPPDTEHRRWLPVHVRGADVDAIVRDREQLWAEAAIRFTVEGIHWSSADTLAQEARMSACGEDGWQEAIQTWIADGEHKYLRMQDILTNAVGLDSRTITQTHERRVARILRGLGYERTQVREGKDVKKVWALA